MQEVAGRMKKFIHAENRIQDSFEMRELCAKFTTDVVGASIYGVEAGAFSGEESEVRTVAKNVMSPSWRLFFIIGLAPFFPWVSNFITVKMCPDREANFLVKLMNDALKYRKENNIERQDYLDFLIHLREKKGISDVEIAAHTVSFFFDGIETSSMTLSTVFYEVRSDQC